ncbi:unnamed protein product [Clonostachys rosea f. rosea IK726]|uniref:Uncharacterized protein n=1 Tax=Clonostachys rosea f. rosea IK726 TaxID=1349383 RepID=A0ACA9U6C7_BIOOC|nr:unnamed protein product [Clonostachys rosea f. rosea IK726]
MYATRVLRQAAVQAQRTPSIRFLGPRTIPSSSTTLPSLTQPPPTASSPRPSSPTPPSRHSSFSSYRDHAQQHGPLQKSIRYSETNGVGGTSGSAWAP